MYSHIRMLQQSKSDTIKSVQLHGVCCSYNRVSHTYLHMFIKFFLPAPFIEQAIIIPFQRNHFSRTNCPGRQNLDGLLKTKLVAIVTVHCIICFFRAAIV